MRSYENQSSVAGLRCENMVLKLLLGDRPTTKRIYRTGNEHIEAMLARFNGHPIALKDFWSGSAEDQSAFKKIIKRGLVTKVARGMYQRCATA